MPRLVMLKPNWPAQHFRRSVRAKDGTVVEVLQFLKGHPPQELTAKQLAAVQKDLGHALIEVTLDGKSRPRPLAESPESVGPEDLEQLTKAELLALAAEHALEIGDKETKAEIVARLMPLLDPPAD